MRQALRIFLKDSRQFRVPILILLAWTVLFAVVLVRDSSWVGALGWATDRTWVLSEVAQYIFPAAWLFLIASVFHADALPGDCQFWLTRPYSRASLFFAKALFVIVYLTLPLMTAQLAVVLAAGLSLAPNLPGLLWEQVLTAVFVFAPAAVAAALTSTLVQFVLVALVTPVLIGVTGGLLDWASLTWIRDAAAACTIAVFAAAVLFAQFRQRRTATSRAVALGGVLVTVAVVAAFPWRAAFALQAHLEPTWDGALTADIVRPPPSVPDRYDPPAIRVRFTTAGGAPDTATRCEAVDLNFENAQGHAWKEIVRSIESPTGKDVCSIRLGLPEEFLDAVAEERVRLRATLYVTVFGRAQSTSIPIGQTPTLAPFGGRCAGTSSQEQKRTAVACVYGFRLPRAWYATTTMDGEWSENSSGLPSYSPFPADLRIVPTIRTSTAVPRVVDTVTLTGLEPVAHLRLPIDVADLHLGDFRVGRVPR